MTAKHTNRLARETSPYLQQHQHNPVDWHPWGKEAFSIAREQNKPIFLSVGYSTCYWCHVMERQSFENEEIAALMNSHFVNIKVDREERPDVDQLYMTAVQVMTRQGGWPMSVWLLPDQRPFFGGTYFPPADSHGRPGLPSILEGLADAFAQRRSDIEHTATQLTNVLEELARPVVADEAIRMDFDWVGAIADRSVRDYDARYGGFGKAPKFPRQTLLEFLLDWIEHLKSADSERAEEFIPLLRHTLTAMANGGIRDQLGGAFHRYSTDAQWLVPHFEIMLYDNALLGGIYARAARLLDEPRFADVARRIFDFVLSDMTSPEGAFFTAIDAEVDSSEGKSYLWTLPEIEQVLPPREASIFATVYGIDRGPNFFDPHGGDGSPTHNVLFLADPSRENEPALIAMRDQLLQHRRTRKQPLTDTKIITGWNALMIRALADAGRLLDEPRYIEAANRAADYIGEKHRLPDGVLARTSRDGIAKQPAFLDDYAYFAQALLALQRRDEAEIVTTAMVIGFNDVGHGGFFFTDADHDDLIVRQKIGADSPLPAGNAVAAMVCDQLGRAEQAAAALKAFAVQANHHGEAMSAHVRAVLSYIQFHGPLQAAAQEKPQGYAPPDPKTLAQAAVLIEPALAGESHAVLTVTVDPGHHITASSLALHAAPNTFGEIEIPPPTRRKYPYADEEQEIYEGRFAIGLQLLQPPAAGEELLFELGFQACTETACLPEVRRTIVLKRQD